MGWWKKINEWWLLALSEQGTLAAESKWRYDFVIAIDVCFWQVPQKSASLTHELQQPATGVVIMDVHAQMFSQWRYSFSQKCYLNFSGSSITFFLSIGFDCLYFFFVSHSKFEASQSVAIASDCRAQKFSSVIDLVFPFLFVFLNLYQLELYQLAMIRANGQGILLFCPQFFVSMGYGSMILVSSFKWLRV